MIIKAIIMIILIILIIMIIIIMIMIIMRKRISDSMIVVKLWNIDTHDCVYACEQ